MKVSEGRSKPKIDAEIRLLNPLLVLGSPFLYQVLIVTHLYIMRGMQCCL